MKQREARAWDQSAELDQKKKVLDKMKKEEQWSEDDAWREQRLEHRKQIQERGQAQTQQMWEAKQVDRWCQQRLRDMLVPLTVQANGHLAPELSAVLEDAEGHGKKSVFLLRHARSRSALHEYERPLNPLEGCAPIRTIINVSASEPHHFASATQPEHSELDKDEQALCFQYHRCILERDGEEDEALEQAACFAEQRLAAMRPVLVHGGPEKKSSKAVGDDAHGNSQVLSSPAESEDSQLLQQIHMAFIAYGGVTSVEAAAVVAALLVRQHWTPQLAVKAYMGTKPSKSNSREEVAAEELKKPSLKPPLAVLPPVVEGFLWLGNADAAEGTAENAFDCLINATASLPWAPSAPSRQLRVPLAANAGLPELACHWANLLSFLHTARAAGHRCLIYGTHGRSRPAALAMGYMMVDQGLSFAAALKAVRRKYPLAHPSAALVDAVTTLSSEPEEAAGKSALKAWAGSKGSSPSAVPLALTNGSAKAELDEEALEAAVRQLGELLPVPADLRREALVRFSGDIERAASQLISWLEGDAPQQTSASSSSSASASASASAPAPASAGASAAASAASAQRSEPCTRKRSASEDGTASSEPRTEAPRLAQCYLEGQEQLPECVICSRSSKRGGAAPEPHADLGWVHSVCLQQASWT
ncbi:Mkp3 [Symbiodinium pilosum]|uniref:protein-tyrosine-phosphatase n=1 Tax=Symbiodinium pilosum TaxID=2952 RepID=A0A812TNE7_SYMPI|nr:Mkp3 [Symbiodinium pilosum]